jgi:hypothetical protein
MRQRPSVLQHLAQVAHVEVSAAGGALEEVLGLGRVRLIDALADDLAAPERPLGVRHRTCSAGQQSCAKISGNFHDTGMAHGRFRTGRLAL